MNPVLLVNTYAQDGGAARATLRLHRGLRRAGWDSRMLVQFSAHGEPGVMGPTTPWEKTVALFRRQLEGLPAKRYPNRTGTLFSPGAYSSPQVFQTIRATVGPVHLHWVQKGMLSVTDIGRLDRPFFWTFHDMWALTGGEHYDEGLDTIEGPWRSSRVLGSRRQHGLSYLVWRSKERFWSDLPVTVVAPSLWMAGLAARSPFFKDKPIHVVPNGIDTKVFRPIDKGWAQSLLGVPEGKRVLLFGAMDATCDPRKGFDLLVGALGRMGSTQDLHLLIVGAMSATGLSELGISYQCLGFLGDELSLVVAYNAADAVVVPSRQENLSNMVLEAMACGVPCVAFRVGGNPDMIVHGTSGYLAEPEDSIDLARGLEALLFQNDSDPFRRESRDRAVTEFSMELCAQRHIQLYDSSTK